MARRFVVVLGLALLVAVGSAAGGGDLRSRKESVDSRLDALHARIAAAAAREDALAADIAGVTNEIRGLEAEVGDVSSRVAALENDLALHRERLAKLDKLYALQTERLRFVRRQYAIALARLNERIVRIYQSDDPSTLEVLLSSASFSDLLDQLDYLRQIGAEDRRVATDVGVARAQVRAARARTRRTRAKVQSATRAIRVRVVEERALRDRLVATRSALTGARTRKRESLAAVRESRREFVAEADALAAESAEIAARLRAAAEESPAAPPAGSGTPSSSGLIWPVSGPVVSPFGMHWGRMHEGIDIAAAYGTPIAAAASGTVVYAGSMSGYGNLVVIDHGGGLATAYAHQSSIAVGVGQSVTQGQTIGYVGCTGHCFGPHLHFEVRINGAPVDPLGYL
jgi:murein DD-endopeptidase MepM/ murein hydrolase activator NlpD